MVRDGIRVREIGEEEVVRHLLASYELGRDRLYGRVKVRKGRTATPTTRHSATLQNARTSPDAALM